MCAGCGLEIGVPYADHRLAEYVFNVPWEFKNRNEIRKALLRAAAKDLLPDEILYRKKSPYPKTYHPKFEKLVADRLLEVINDPTSPILNFVDKAMVERFIETPSDYGKPWFGQLMAGPQMMGYLIQIDYWMKEYKIELS
jgi:asparagine synthase (glutamine-hydrolysing)